MKRLPRKEENCLVRYIVDKLSSLPVSDVGFEIDNTDKYRPAYVLSYDDVKLLSRPSMLGDGSHVYIEAPIDYPNFRWLNEVRLQNLFDAIRKKQINIIEADILDRKRKDISYILDECK